MVLKLSFLLKLQRVPKKMILQLLLVEVEDFPVSLLKEILETLETVHNQEKVDIEVLLVQIQEELLLVGLVFQDHPEGILSGPNHLHLEWVLHLMVQVHHLLDQDNPLLRLDLHNHHCRSVLGSPLHHLDLDNNHHHLDLHKHHHHLVLGNPLLHLHLDNNHLRLDLLNHHHRLLLGNPLFHLDLDNNHLRLDLDNRLLCLVEINRHLILQVNLGDPIKQEPVHLTHHHHMAGPYQQ